MATQTFAVNVNYAHLTVVVANIAVLSLMSLTHHSLITHSSPLSSFLGWICFGPGQERLTALAGSCLADSTAGFVDFLLNFLFLSAKLFHHVGPGRVRHQ